MDVIWMWQSMYVNVSLPLNEWFWQLCEIRKGSEVFPKIIILTFQGIKWLKVRKYHTLTYPSKNGWELCMCDCNLLWKWWIKDGSVLSYQLLDPLLLDEKSEESAEHGWKLYLLLDDEPDESAENGWKSIRLGRYTKYKLHFPPSLIDWLVLKWWQTDERKLASSATKYGSSSLRRSMAQILLCD